MARLIDADSLNKKKKYTFQTVGGCFPQFEQFIKAQDLFDAPTIDAVEVVHAKWQNEGFGCWSCSSCLEIFTFDNYGDVHPKDDCGCNYCPNCGARMDGDSQ